MDPIVLTIIGVSTTLTLLLVVIGIQIFNILKEVRVSVQKTNKMLDDAGKVTGTVSEGVENMSMITSLKKKAEHHE
jgi:ABC-type multidrug transport system fused ATPase/permease subunit